MRRPRASSVVATVVSVVSLAAVAHWIAGQEPPRLPAPGTGYAWLGLALVVNGAALALRAWRWHRIMRSAGVAHRRRDAAGLTLVGYMGNNVLPARGGELLKIGLLGSRTPARHREVLGTVLVERLLDAAVLVALFATLTWAGASGSASLHRAATLAATALALAAVGVAGYLRLRRRGLLHRFAAAIRPVAGAARLLSTRAGAVLAGASLAIWWLDGLTVLLGARSVGIQLSAVAALAAVVLASLAATIPAAPGYVGTFDAAMLLGLHSAGVRGGDAVSVLLMARFVLFVPVTVVGLGTLVLGYGGFAARRRRLREGAAA